MSTGPLHAGARPMEVTPEGGLGVEVRCGRNFLQMCVTVLQRPSPERPRSFGCPGVDVTTTPTPPRRRTEDEEGLVVSCAHRVVPHEDVDGPGRPTTHVWPSGETGLVVLLRPECGVTLTNVYV